MRTQYCRLIFGLTALFVLFSMLAHDRAAQAQGYVSPAQERGLVIYAYHRIEEAEHPTTNLSSRQFESHIAHLLDNKFNVVPLKDGLDAIFKHTNLPEKTVAITFEGGHQSIMQSAVPLLLKHKMPFTIFIAVDQADWQSSKYLSWDELRRLRDTGLVTIGLHPASYGRLLEYPLDEVEKQINRAKSRYRKEMGEEAVYFSYPYGEASSAIKGIVKKYNFKAAFGQQSGVAYSGSDPFNIPRFSMTESFGGIDRFQLTSMALPIPMTDITPEDPLLVENPPAIGFTLDNALRYKKNLACFATTEGQTELEFISDRVEIRLTEPLSAGRARINCTMPAGYTDEGQQRWRWFGLLFTLPPEEFVAEETVEGEDGLMTESSVTEEKPE